MIAPALCCTSALRRFAKTQLHLAQQQDGEVPLMKKAFVHMCLLVSAAILGPATGLAQSLTVKIPFAFAIGPTVMPAGDYFLREDSTGVVFITSQGLGKTIGVLTSADN